MKPRMTKTPVLLAALFLMSATISQAQDTMRAITGARSAKDSAQYSDTAFINNGIRQMIVEVKLAEMAAQKAERPRVKAAAREIMQNDRLILERLLGNIKTKKIPGVSQEELDRVLKSASGDSILSSSDNIPQGVTGNTATDHAGSGSSGSGNLKGEDTGTIARIQQNEPDNDGYSEQGDYAYNNNSFLADVESMGNTKGNKFEARWLEIMMKLQNSNINRYTNAINLSKDDSVRATALAALPRTRMTRDIVMRLIKDIRPAGAVDPNTQKRGGTDDATNRPANGQQR